MRSIKLPAVSRSALGAAAQRPALKPLPAALATITAQSRAYVPKSKGFVTEAKAFTLVEGRSRGDLDFGARANDTDFAQLREAAAPPELNTKPLVSRELLENIPAARRLFSELMNELTAPPQKRPAARTPAQQRAATEARGIHSVWSVTTPQEFVLATLLHVSRVSHLSNELLRRHESAFPGVDAKVLARFVDIHDAAKVFNHPAFLSEFGLERPLAEELVQHWGTLLKSSPKDPHPLIDMVNEVDSALEQRFFTEYGIGVQVARSYRLIVEVSDKVDRGMAPLSRYEEMGKTALPVAEYLSASTDPRDRLIAYWAAELEADYHSLIPEGLNYYAVRAELGIEGVAAFGQRIPAKW